MATIRRRGNRYQAQIRKKGYPPQVKTFYTRSEAEVWARDVESKADKGDLPMSPLESLSKHTLHSLLERYRNEITIKKLSASTEAYIIGAFLRQPIATLRLSELTAAHLSSYRERRLKMVKPGTVNRELSIIKHALDIAHREWGIPIRNNPLATLKKLRVNNARNRRISEEEYRVLIGAVESTRNALIRPLIEFAIETGMRRGEILRISWGDINFENRTLHIPVTKNGHPRTIPLSKRAIEVLRELQVRGDNQPFPISDNAAKLAWQRLVERSGVRDLHFHDFRHEAISRFFERGLSVPEVALISGHRDFKMLFRYTHLRAEDIVGKLD